MAPEPTTPGKAGDGPSVGQGEAKPPAGLSQFLSKVLDQLSLTAWLPAMMLVGNLAVLLEMHSRPDLGVAQAVTELTSKPLGILVVLVFAVVLTAMVTQSLEFAAIRLLEGYWGHSWIANVVGKRCIQRQVRQRKRLLETSTAVERDAFAAARQQLLDLPDAQPVLIAALEAAVLGKDVKGFAPEIVDQAESIDWQLDAPAPLLRRLDSIDHKIAEFPIESRVLPTQLGNTLRAGEDRLKNVVGGDLRGFVIRRLGTMPKELLQEHDQFRHRLDMYCILVAVWVLLAVAAPICLIHQPSDIVQGAGVAVGYLIAAAVSYKAAVASARSYATVLRAIDAEAGN